MASEMETSLLHGYCHLVSTQQQKEELDGQSFAVRLCKKKSSTYGENSSSTDSLCLVCCIIRVYYNRTATPEEAEPIWAAHSHTFLSAS